ncbi:MAG: hypothetical protein K1X29_00850 [Bdellovibrionales bacterium]|nr:hypothetical protein [Bdellovibrionales bacterium]
MKRFYRLFVSIAEGFFITFVVAMSLSCGVKGDPLPPLKPSELGRGRPTFKRAAETIKVQSEEGKQTIDMEINGESDLEELDLDKGKDQNEK